MSEHTPPAWLEELRRTRRVYEGRQLFGEIVFVVLPKDEEDDR